MVDLCTKGPHGGGGSHNILTLEQTFDFGEARGQGTKDQGAMGYRLVPRGANPSL
jgi:hypothetical protein